MIERYRTVSRQRKGTKKVFTPSTSLPVLVRFCKICPGVLKRIITKIYFMVLLIQKLTSQFCTYR